MKVKYIYAVRFQFGQRFVQHLLDHYGIVYSRLPSISLRCKHKASLLPISFYYKGFLFPSNVDTRSVDLIKSLFLEIVQTFIELIETGDTCATGFIRPKCPRVNDRQASVMMFESSHMRPKMTRGFLAWLEGCIVHKSLWS